MSSPPVSDNIKDVMDNERADVPAHAKTADDGFPKKKEEKRLEEELWWIVPRVPLPAP